MNRWIPNIAIALAVVVPATAGAAERREQSARDWDARGITRIEVENPRGDVAVMPSRDGRVHLVALKILRHAERRGGTELSAVTRLVTDQADGVLRIRVQYPQHREIRIWDLMKDGGEIPEIEVRVALEVPGATPVALRTASGDVQTTGLAGIQHIVTSSGDIDIDTAGAALAIETRSGDATLSDIVTASVGTASGRVVVTSARGPLRIGTRSGDVRVDASADSLDVSTASGEVRVGHARGGFDVQTGSGDVIARGAGRVRIRTASGETKVALVAPLQEARLSSGSGDITVRVATGIEGDVDADAGNGTVDVQLPLDPRSIKDNHVVGRLGRGRTEIIVRSTSGTVNVTR